MNNYKSLLLKSPFPFVIIKSVGEGFIIEESNKAFKENIKENILEDFNKRKEIEEIIKYGQGDIDLSGKSYKVKSQLIEKELIILWFEKNSTVENKNSRMNFFLNLTHEFKTPLNLIFSSTQLINRKIKDNSFSKEDLLKYSNIVNQNSYRILKLVNNICDDTKVDLGYDEYTPTNTDIVHFIESISESLSEFIKLNNMQIIFDTDIEEMVVSFDMEKMERIILNLISNAVKFRREKGGQILIYLSHNKEYVNVKIRDNGIGISEDNINKIFKKYTRLNDERSIVKEGSGIGLYLVESFIKLHSGSITVDSEFGSWTEFNINIPNKIVKQNDYKIYADNSSRVEKIKIEFSDIYS